MGLLLAQTASPNLAGCLPIFTFTERGTQLSSPSDVGWIKRLTPGAGTRIRIGNERIRYALRKVACEEDTRETGDALSRIARSSPLPKDCPDPHVRRHVRVAAAPFCVPRGTLSLRVSVSTVGMEPAILPSCVGTSRSWLDENLVTLVHS